MTLSECYNNSVLLLPMNGENNGTVFTDLSISGRSVSRTGDVKTSTAQSMYTDYGSSGYFDGSGDYLSFEASAAFSFGTNDFSIFCDVFPESLSGQRHIVGYNNSSSSNFWDLFLDGTSVKFRSRVSGTDYTLTGGSLTVSAWSTIEVRRRSGTLYLFVNGTLVNSSSSFPLPTLSASVLGVGANLYGGAYWYYYHGYMQDLLIVNGYGDDSGVALSGRLSGFISNSGAGVSPVSDASGDPASRIIQALPRGGARVFLSSSDSGGDYAMQLPMMEHNIIFLDNDVALSYSDLMVSRVMPA